MIKYTKIADSIFEIQVLDTDQNLTTVLENNLNYFNSWPNGHTPDYNLPYNLDSVLAPKHYFILEKISPQIPIEQVQNLLNYVTNYPLLVQGIYFVSKDWLVLDEHKIIKADGEINYIFVKNKLYKVFDKNTKVSKLMDLNDIGPNSWFWRIEV